MAPLFPRNTTQQRREARDEDLLARLDWTEHRLHQVENALHGVAHETGNLSIGGPCQSCGESLMLIKQGMMYCPKCGYRRSL